MSVTVPNALALTGIADGSSIVASDHRNNYAAAQVGVNGLIAMFTAAPTKGDLLISAGGGAFDRLGVGANGQEIVADSTQTLGMKWAAAPGPVNFSTFTGQSLASALTANQAYYMPVFLPTSFTATALKWVCGTQSGNYDIGIYDASFAKVWSIGSTACPAAGGVSVAISSGTPTTLTLAAGVYYLAFAFNNTTATAHVTTGASAAVSGFTYTKATSFALPSSLASGTTPSASGHGVWVGMV